MKTTCKILLFFVLQFVSMPVFKAIRHHVKLRRIGQEMTDDGQKNLISFGDHALNLYECGNKNGVHTINSLTSRDDGEAQIGWRKMTADLESENRLIFLDRAGYGLSDDSAQDITAEQVVSDDRAALQNAGVEAPYLLLAHSMGGTYAAYWESKFPDESESVSFVYGSDWRNLQSGRSTADSWARCRKASRSVQFAR